MAHFRLMPRWLVKRRHGVRIRDDELLAEIHAYQEANSLLPGWALDLPAFLIGVALSLCLLVAFGVVDNHLTSRVILGGVIALFLARRWRFWWAVNAYLTSSVDRVPQASEPTTTLPPQA